MLEWAPWFRRAGTLIVVGLTLSVTPAASGSEGVVDAACTFDGHPLHGKVKVVESFPDVKIKVVESFPDLKVKTVDSFPDACGEWKFVESFPDVKVKFVDSFPDVKVKFVDSFPGRP